jgi:hypothetical protein
VEEEEAAGEEAETTEHGVTGKQEGGNWCDITAPGSSSRRDELDTADGCGLGVDSSESDEKRGATEVSTTVGGGGGANRPGNAAAGASVAKVGGSIAVAVAVAATGFRSGPLL